MSSRAAGKGEPVDYFLCTGRQDGTCDLPHLPVTLVEDALLREVQSLQLTAAGIATMREQVTGHFDQRLNAEREVDARVKKERAAFDAKEERLLDLVAEGSLTTEKVRDRLGKLQVQRNAPTQRLATTAEVVQQESEMILTLLDLLDLLDLLERPGAFSAATSDNVKRKLLAAYFAQIWVDDVGHEIILDTQPQVMVAQIQELARTGGQQTKQAPSRNSVPVIRRTQPIIFMAYV